MATAARGRFITLEGADGVGKTTQAERLHQTWNAQGARAIRTAEPCGAGPAAALQRLLTHPDPNAGSWAPMAEALGFITLRNEHVVRLIEPNLTNGNTVICDRYLDSTEAYQSGPGGPDPGQLRRIHDTAIGLMPDRTLVLMANPDTIAERRAARGRPADRFETRGEKYRTDVIANYERILAREPERCVRIDASGDADTTRELIWAAVQDLLPKRSGK